MVLFGSIQSILSTIKFTLVQFGLFQSYSVHLGLICFIRFLYVCQVQFSLFWSILSTLSYSFSSVLFCPLWLYQVVFSPLRSYWVDLVLFGSHWFYSVYFGTIRSIGPVKSTYVYSVHFDLIQSISVRFGSFGLLRYYSVHFGSLQSSLVLFGPIQFNQVHSVLCD